MRSGSLSWCSWWWCTVVLWWWCSPVQSASLARDVAANVLGLPVNAQGELTQSLVLLREDADWAVWGEVRGLRDEWQEAKVIPRQAFTEHVAGGAEDVVAACVWRGLPVFTLPDVVRSTKRFFAGKMPSKKYKRAEDWVRDTCQRAEIGFISYFYDEVLSVTWVNPDTNKTEAQFAHRLEAGEKQTLWIESYIGHKFLVKGKKFEKIYTVKWPSIHIVHRGIRPDYAALGRKIPDESKRYVMRTEFKRVQQVTQVFTDVGFKKIRCPPELWGEVKTYWNNNKGVSHRAIEEWLDTGFFVNWHEVNQDLTVPPMQLKRHWQELFRPYVEAWIGGIPLEATDIYGIRTYHDGAWLSNHVDREHTHAASAILNVEQVGVRENWNVHIWDIHGKRHIVTLEPGYMLFYESARCMHGRPVPLKGQEYTNVFLHYRPKGKPYWFKDPTIGKRGPDISHVFDLKLVENHDSGWVGKEAEEGFKDYPVDANEIEIERDEL